jgi:quercetin dioxygenase-like cupin family protein
MNFRKEENIIYEKVSTDFERRIVHLENLMVVACDFKNGPMVSPDPPHSHPHEQITYVAEGELLFFKEGKEHHLLKGDLITVPSSVSHSIQTLTPYVKLIDSFYPVRKEFLKRE